MQTEPQKREIKIAVTELILTPLTCASIINEILKQLIYQKSQIPYSYSWVKSAISRRKTEPNKLKVSTDITVQRHHDIVSTAFNALENIMQNIKSEFKDNEQDIKQVCILFGSTIYTAKEAYIIEIPQLAKNHLEENHVYLNSKKQHNILRNIILNNEWMSAMETAIPPTCMYVLLQKCLKGNGEAVNNTFFKTNLQYSLPKYIKSMTISLSYDDDRQYNCCDNLSIFEDLPLTSTCQSECESVSEFTYKNNDVSSNLLWCEASTVLKGFKECFVNGVSATELW